MVRHTKTTVKAPISLEVEAFFIFTFASYLTIGEQIPLL